MKWNLHPKQLEFLNDDRPRVLYGGGLPTRADSTLTLMLMFGRLMTGRRPTMMTGTIKNVLAGKNFGFIRDGQGVEYFFHREEFNGHWDDLIDDMANGTKKIRVEFEPTSTPKGARAVNVSRVDHPNTGR